MNRTRLAQTFLALVVVLAALASGCGVGSALAEPTTTAPTTSTEAPATETPATEAPPTEPAADEEPAPEASSGEKKLPKGFPADLRKLVAGTEEFKTASWFKGVCANRGGDVAAYIGQVFTHEAEMMFWRLPEEQRWKLLAARTPLVDPRMGVSGDPAKLKAKVESGELRPTDKNGWLPGAYPTTRDSEWPSTEPRCADDIQRWSSKAMTTWGFEWAKVVDQWSADAMIAAVKHDGDPARTARNIARIAKPCEGDGAFWFCEHAYFLNCDKETRRQQLKMCRDWNVNVARLFAGTDNWLEQNKDVQDRAEEAVTAMWKMTPIYIAGKAVASAFSALWGATVGPVVEFFKDAKELPEKWANYMKKSAMDMIDTVLPALASVGEFDMRQPWFLKMYAMSFGLGLAVMCIMFMLAAVSAARNGGADTLSRDIVGYLPLGILMMMYTPMLAGIFQLMMHVLTQQMTQMMGTTTDQLVENVSSTLGALTNETLVGGVIMGIIGFGLIVFGMLALYLGMLMHQFGIPLAAIGAAIGYGMMVYPKMRPKALKIPLMLISLMASVPILFLMLWVVFEVINNALTNSTTGDGKIASLGSLMAASFGFFIVGVAPFSLLKWAPMLPSEEDADRMGGSGSGSGQLVGNMGSGSPMHSRINNNAPSSSHSAPATQSPAGSPPSSGGRHAAAPAGGGKKLGKVAALAAAPATGTAAKLAQAAGQATRAGVSAGTRATAMNAANRAHSVAADSAPTSS